MKRLVFQKKGIIDWEECPAPVITGPNQAIVRPLAIARCDLDIPIVLGQTLFRPPFAIGHEFVGSIESVSEDLAGQFQKGDRVAVAFQISCGTCPMCTGGLSKNCTTVTPAANYGMAPAAKEFGGALADFVKVPFASSMLVRLPPNVPAASVASLSDNIAEAWKLAGSVLSNRPSSTVLILGGVASSIGLYTAMLAKTMTKGSVLYMDTDPARVLHAERLGIQAEHVKEFPKSRGKFDLVCECAASEAGWTCATRSVAPAGVLTTASIFWTNKLEIPFLEFYNGGVELRISRVDSREMMEKMLTLISDGTYDPGLVTTSTASLADAKEAWMEPATKLVITNE
ncbi:MAG TPA: alcohol dehydrogenase catalytic domain-containing protein [Leptospiraceae bacterium]|nr:alcohol dehydrogenase catalytic domain-containing protein [Leptospiraceae bacterium]